MTTKQERELQAFALSRHPIKLCLEPLRVEAMDYAEKIALEQIERVRKELAEHGDDIDKAAPRPRHDVSRFAYMVAQQKRGLFDFVTVWRKEANGHMSYHAHGPRLVDVCPERSALYVKNAREDAALAYDLYRMKLCTKCGDGVEAATIEGNHIWSESFLTITRADGAREVWKTQTIDNVSKLGKPFLQFPTRKLKDGATYFVR